MKNLLLSILLILSSAIITLAQEIPPKAKKAYSDADMAVFYDKKEEAIKHLKKAIKIYPKYVRAIVLRAKLEGGLKNYDTAIQLYTDLIDIVPEDECKVYFQIGKLLIEQEKYPEAIINFEKSINTPNCQASTIKNANDKKQLCEFRDSMVNNPVVFAPQAFDSLINSTQYHDYLPMLTADGEHLFFTKRMGVAPIYNENFFEASKDQNGNWQKAKDMGEPINTEFNEGALTISPDGKRLFFAAMDRFGGEGNFDIWYSYKKNGKWIRPLNLGRPVNGPLWESQPSIAADGKELFFAAKNGEGEGGIDLFVSHLVDNIWQAPVNLGKTINTEGDEQCPFIHPDGKTLYFSSNGLRGMGSSDLFVVRRNAFGEWGEPQNLGYPINSLNNENSLFVSADGKTGYYAQYINNSFDLVSFDIPKHAQPNAVTYVKGTVASAVSKLFINATIEIYDASSGELLAITQTTEKETEFLITLPIGKNYIFSVNNKAYLPHSENFSLVDAEILKSYELEIFLNPIPTPIATVVLDVPKVENKIVMKNITFETSSANLKVSSFIELNKIVDILNENSNITMSIEGHTDNVGSDSDNLNLSQQRADSVKKHLVQKGINSSRLSTTGKGETMPIDTNDTPEGRANNRRTEFIILD